MEDIHQRKNNLSEGGGTEIVMNAETEAPAALVEPADWHQVGTRGEFYVRSAQLPDSIQLQVFERDNFLNAGLEKATFVTTIRFSRTPHESILLGIPEQPIPPGDYIMRLKSCSHPEWVKLSGVLVRESEDTWPKVFAQMDARCRAAMSQPAKLCKTPLGRILSRPMFSITTTVYNTDPLFLQELWNYLKAQSYPDFEWVLLDNGSEDNATRAKLREIAAEDARIRSFRVKENLHIIGGNRYVLERARGRYIVPIDSDDIVYPYALEIVHDYARKNRYPDLLFSDEHKVSLIGTPREYLWRPDWSRLSTLSTCPASHLMVFDRRAALRVEAYTGDYARGSHDWDTALRLDEKDPRIMHIPEVLYGWRMHMGSAAMNEGSKQYLLDSQRGVVCESMARRGLGTHFDVEGRGQDLGYYHLKYQRVKQPSLLIDVVVTDVVEQQEQTLAHNLRMMEYPNCSVRVHLCVTNSDLRVMSRALTLGPRNATACEFAPYHEERELVERLCARGGIYGEAAPTYQVILYNGIRVSDPDWLWDGLATFELDKDIGIVGGCIVDQQGGAVHVGYVAGLDGFFACPQPGELPESIFGAIGRIRRSVTAVYGSFTMLRTDLFPRVGLLRGFDSYNGAYGVEFCARVRKAGFGVAFTPRMRGVALIPLATTVPDSVLGQEMLAQHGPSVLRDPYYSVLCSKESRTYGRPRPMDISDSKAMMTAGV